MYGVRSMVPPADDLERARTQGREDALAAAEQHAPEDPALRIAWAMGFGTVEHLRDAVAYARERGLRWVDIAEVTGEPDAVAAESRYGGGARRQREYRARKRGEEPRED